MCVEISLKKIFLIQTHLSVAIEHRLFPALLASARAKALFRALMKHCHQGVFFLLFEISGMSYIRRILISGTVKRDWSHFTSLKKALERLQIPSEVSRKIWIFFTRANFWQFLSENDVQVRVNFRLMTDICREQREIWILDINMDINVNITLTDPHQTFTW